jgi:hypothetical protein
MRSVFSQFKNYADADEAVRTLQEKGFVGDDINVLVLAQVAKSNMDEVNLARVHVDVTDAVGEQELSGLALLVGNEQPVHVRGVGPVLAAGQLATILANTATETSRADDDLQTMLVSYGIPEETAGSYHAVLTNGGVLAWVRTGDSRVGEVAEVFRSHNGKAVTANQTG